MTQNKPQKKPRKASPEYLERVALWYLERFAASAASLRRVLVRRVDRSVEAHGTDRAEALAWVEAILEKCQRSGLIDDKRYAEMKVSSLHRRGTSTRAIRQKLAAKGVDTETVGAALEELAEDTTGELDLNAAVAFARRRRLGPFRPAHLRETHRERDMAALGRAGFSYDIARKVVMADDPDSILDE